MKSNHVICSKTNNKKRVPVLNECLLNNIIDKEFQAVLYPLTIFQSFFLMSKFTIINNFVTPNNKLSNFIISIVGATFLVLTRCFQFYFYYNELAYFKSDVLNCLLYLDLIFYIIITFLTYIVNILQCSNTVELIIRLQKVLNSIKIDKNRFLFKLKIENWINILSVVSIYGTFGSIYFLNGFFAGFVSFLVIAPLVIYDLHMINAIRAVVFIRNELDAWKSVMEQYKKITGAAEKDIENKKSSESVMFDSYLDIVKAFQLCNKVYQFSFTYFGFHTFMYVLSGLQMLLEFGKAGSKAGFSLQSIMMWTVSAGWNAKNICLLISLSVACENFYKSVKMVESCCAQIASNDHSSGLRKTCKNVLRVNRVALRKLSAYGIFELDAVFPARLLGGIVAYTVVLLQFAFL